MADPAAFVAQNAGIAQAYGQRYGIDPRLLLAIPGSESNWGASPTYFGIQCAGYPTCHEYVSQGSDCPGCTVNLRTYSSFEQGVQDFIALVSGSGRYTQAWANRGDPQAFVHGLQQAGYGPADWPGNVLGTFMATVQRLWSGAQSTISSVGRWLSPFTGSAPVTQPFGPTDLAVEPAYAGYPHFHEGIDFGVAEGTPVQSVAAGTVLSAGVLGGYGNAIEVDLGNGITTLYGHLSQILVQKGQSVAGGTVLGLSGNTGASTGPHLHFGVMQNGQWVDPAPYLYGTAAPGTGSTSGNADSATLGLTSKSCAPWDIPCLERAAAGAAVGAAGSAVTSGFKAIFTSGLMTRLALGTAGVLALVIGLFVLANDATGGGVADAAKAAAV